MPALRLRTIALATVTTVFALAVLYLLAGFLLVGKWVKSEAPKALAATGHQLRLGDLAFNPITLTARGKDIAIDDANGKPVFSAGLIEVDVEWRSLFKRAIVLSSAKVDKPIVHAVIDEQGQLNLAALSRDDGQPSQGLPRFYVGNLEVTDGGIAFSDLREPYANRFEQLSLKLSALSTLDTNQGPYTLTAQTPDGTKLNWQGELSLQPLALAGKLDVSDVLLPALSPYLDAYLAAPVAAGRASLQLPHRFFVKDGKPQLLVEDASAEITDLVLQGPVLAPAQAPAAVSKPQATSPSVKLTRLAIEGVNLDLLARQLAAKTLRLEGLGANVQRASDGTLDIAHLIRSPAKTETHSEKSSPAQTESPAPAWAISLARAELAGGSLAFTDAASGIAMALENLSGHVNDLTLDSKELAFEIAGNVRGGGKLSSRGRVLLQEGGFKGRVEAAGIPVALLQPLLAKNYRLRLASGEATLAGEVEVGGKNAKFSYIGSAAINNVALHESAGEKAGEKATESSRLLAWKTLATDKLSLSLSPDRASMDELRIVAPVGRLVIAADRSINLRRAFAADNPNADAEKPAPLKVAAPATPAASTPAAMPDKPTNAADAGGFAVSIRRVRVSDGMLDFSDQTLAQGFNIAIQELGGVFNGLSSDRSTRSQFSLEGKVGEFGYAKLSGGLNPFEWRDRTTMRVEFRNLDLARISPYSIKFAGYRIASGRLSLDLRYRINNNIVEGDNQAVFEQLTLGEKVQSPDALDLPIELAVSLLKDDQGRIDIAIPVSGSLDDPQFDYGTLIRNAIGNVISRIITAPFRALASLFGGSRDGEEIGTITFEPGQSRLLPPEREKILRIAKGLEKRPEIKVTVPGRADSEVDGSRLKREALAREISRRAGFEVSDDESAGGISIEDGRTRTAIRDLYAERLTPAELDTQRAQAEAAAREGKAEKPAVLDRVRNLATGEPQVTNPRPFYNNLMRRLRESQALPPGALEQLAENRAQAIARGLRDAGFAESRISTSVVAPTANAKAKDVKVELALDKK